MLADVYYLRIMGTILGPLSKEEIERLRDLGRLQPFHEVSRDGRTWAPARSFNELFPAAPASEEGETKPPAKHRRSSAARQSEREARDIDEFQAAPSSLAPALSEVPYSSENPSHVKRLRAGLMIQACSLTALCLMFLVLLIGLTMLDHPLPDFLAQARKQLLPFVFVMTPFVFVMSLLIFIGSLMEMVGMFLAAWYNRRTNSRVFGIAGVCTLCLATIFFFFAMMFEAFTPEAATGPAFLLFSIIFALLAWTLQLVSSLITAYDIRRRDLVIFLWVVLSVYMVWGLVFTVFAAMSVMKPDVALALVMVFFILGMIVFGLIVVALFLIWAAIPKPSAFRQSLVPQT
ncbi:MAG: hypothetical protein C4297_13565 [Gemmataceae bacterium]